MITHVLVAPAQTRMAKSDLVLEDILTILTIQQHAECHSQRKGSSPHGLEVQALGTQEKAENLPQKIQMETLHRRTLMNPTIPSRSHQISKTEPQSLPDRPHHPAARLQVQVQLPAFPASEPKGATRVYHVDRSCESLQKALTTHRPTGPDSVSTEVSESSRQDPKSRDGERYASYTCAGGMHQERQWKTF